MELKSVSSRELRPCAAPAARRPGFVVIYMAAAMFVIAAIAALTFDMSRLRSAKGELQAAADSAAFNGVNGLKDGTYLAKAQAAASENSCDGTAVSLVSANVVPGNWASNTFTANGSPRNAIRVTAARTGATAVRTYVASMIGITAANVQATSTVALIKQAPYEWTGIDGVNLNANNGQFKVSSYDATNTGAAEQKTSIKSNGAISLAGSGTFNADVGYGTTVNVANSATVTGSISQNAKTLDYPPGSQVANISGTPVYQTTSDLTVNSTMTLGGGTYVIRNCNISNCTITFTGPVTIILSGNLNMTNCGFATSGNLPANLKIISTATDNAINLNGLTRTLNADFYAPGTTFSMTASNGQYGLNGRGVFKTMNVSGAGAAASFMYDRSLTASSLSEKAVLVR